MWGLGKKKKEKKGGKLAFTSARTSVLIFIFKQMGSLFQKPCVNFICYELVLNSIQISANTKLWLLSHCENNVAVFDLYIFITSSFNF